MNRRNTFRLLGAATLTSLLAVALPQAQAARKPAAMSI